MSRLVLQFIQVFGLVIVATVIGVYNWLHRREFKNSPGAQKGVLHSSDVNGPLFQDDSFVSPE